MVPAVLLLQVGLWDLSFFVACTACLYDLCCTQQQKKDQYFIVDVVVVAVASGFFCFLNYFEMFVIKIPLHHHMIPEPISKEKPKPPLLLVQCPVSCS